MKKKWKNFRAVLTICAAFGWWGLLYPELTLTPETVIVCEIDSDNRQHILTEHTKQGRNLYRELLCAERGSITFRSKLLEDLSLFWEALQNGIQ